MHHRMIHRRVTRRSSQPAVIWTEQVGNSSPTCPTDRVSGGAGDAVAVDSCCPGNECMGRLAVEDDAQLSQGNFSGNRPVSRRLWLPAASGRAE